MSKKVSDILPKTEILAQLAEEASELAQAALKLRRALDGTNPTPKSVEECRKAFEEEYADVMVCIRYIAKGRSVLAASAVLWPVGGADSVSLCDGLPTKKCTSQRLNEC